MQDPNLIAMLNVHGAALLAICQTHPEPQKLREAFGFYAESLDLPETSPAVGGYQQSWIDVFHEAIRRNARNA